ncbi:MAG: hypothetical protein WD851_07885 [Pirellulales bacterium]
MGAVIDDIDIQVAVVIVVETEQAASLSRIGHAGGTGNVRKHAVVILVDVRLVAGVPAVGDKQIQIAVIVVVEEGGSPRPAGIADGGEIGLIGESAVAVVPVEAVAAVVFCLAGHIDQGRNEPIQPPVAVEVADRRSHAVLVGTQTCGNRAVGERAVAIVPKQLTGFEIAGNREVWVAIAVDVGEGRRVTVGEGVGPSAVVVRGAINVEARRRGHVLEMAWIGGTEIP